MSSLSIKQRPSVLGALAAPGIICLGFFFLMPLAIVIGESLAGGGSGYIRLFSSREFWSGLSNTLVLGFTAALLSTVIGCLVALHLSRLAEGPRTALLFVISLPLTFSGLVVAFGFILSFGRAGFFTIALSALTGIEAATIASFVYSPNGLAFVYAYYLTPRVIMLILPVLINFDQNQILAAEALGASRRRAILDIMVPQVFPSAIGAYCLVVAVAFGAYGTALALVGTQVNILPLQLFAQVSDVNTDFPRTAALAMLLTLMCSLTMAVGETLAGSKGSTAH